MNRRNLWVVAAAIFCCGIMAVVDGVIQPGYAPKSAIKILVFGLIPLILTRFHRELQFTQALGFRRKGFALALGLGLGVYGLILGGYFLVRNFFDFSGIAGSLLDNAGVSKENFLYVSLYISLVNSLLEELFFRGFLFLNLKHRSRRFAYVFSAGAFAAYHVAMMIGWFSPVLWLLVMAGLFVGGLIFNWLNEKQESIYPSWLVHMFANFAINTIGFILLSA